MKIEVTMGKFSKGQIVSAERQGNTEKARKLYKRWRYRSKESKIYLATMFAIAEGVCPFCGIDMILRFNDYDGQDIATLDHTEPLSKTLTHDKLGLQLMCRKCNLEKGNVS